MEFPLPPDAESNRYGLPTRPPEPPEPPPIVYSRAIRGTAHAAIAFSATTFFALVALLQLASGESDRAMTFLIFAGLAAFLDVSSWRNDIIEAHIDGGRLHWRTETTDGEWDVADIKVVSGRLPLIAPRLARPSVRGLKRVARGDGRDELIAHIRAAEPGAALTRWSWRR